MPDVDLEFEDDGDNSRTIALAVGLSVGGLLVVGLLGLIVLRIVYTPGPPPAFYPTTEAAAPVSGAYTFGAQSASYAGTYAYPNSYIYS